MSTLTPALCIHCHKPILPAEHTAYNGRCEECWTVIQQEACQSGTLSLVERVKMNRSQENHGWRSRGQRIRSMK